MTDELKNCPFCGSDAIGQVQEEDFGDVVPETYYGVACLGCGTSSGWFFTKQEAAQGWNTRAGTASELDKAEGRLNQVKLANSFLYRERDALRAQRDELLAACEVAVPHLRRAALDAWGDGNSIWERDWNAAADRLEAAIRSVKEA